MVIADDYDRLKALAEFPERNPNPVLEVSSVGTILYANPATADCLQQLGFLPTQAERLLPDDYPQRLWDLRASGRINGYWECPVGDRVLSYNIVVLENSSLYHLYISDITEHRQAQESAAICNRELGEIEGRLAEKARLAAIGEFTASIVHEIRNPLSTIGMALDFFSQAELPESIMKRAEVATAESLRLQRLLSEILLYARPARIQLKPLNIDYLVSDTLATFHDDNRIDGKRIEVSTTPALSSVLGDMDKLKQVFINLLANACDAAPEGDTIYWSVVNDDPQRVKFIFRNGGDPIPKKILDRIVEPFLTTKPRGTGLGLAIVKRIIDAHDGQLEIRSSKSKGTQVVVSLQSA